MIIIKAIGGITHYFLHIRVADPWHHSWDSSNQFHFSSESFVLSRNKCFPLLLKGQFFTYIFQQFPNLRSRTAIQYNLHIMPNTKLFLITSRLSFVLLISNKSLSRLGIRLVLIALSLPLLSILLSLSLYFTLVVCDDPDVGISFPSLSLSFNDNFHHKGHQSQLLNIIDLA